TSRASSHAISSSTAKPGAAMPSSLVKRTRSSTLPSLWCGPDRECRRLLTLFRRTLELDDVAVRVVDVKRRAVALGTVTPPDFADSDAVLLQMRRQRREIEGGDAHREVVEVASWRCLRRLRGGAGRHQVDHRRTGAQLHELGFVEPALDMTAQHLSVEFDCPVKIDNPQYEVVEPGDLDRASPRSLSTLEIP